MWRQRSEGKRVSPRQARRLQTTGYVGRKCIDTNVDTAVNSDQVFLLINTYAVRWDIACQTTGLERYQDWVDGIRSTKYYVRISVGPPGAPDTFILVVYSELDVGNTLQETNPRRDPAEARTNHEDFQRASSINRGVAQLVGWTCRVWSLRLMLRFRGGRPFRRERPLEAFEHGHK